MEECKISVTTDILFFSKFYRHKNFSPASISINNPYWNTIFSMHLGFPEVLCFLYTINAAEEHTEFKFWGKVKKLNYAFTCTQSK